MVAQGSYEGGRGGTQGAAHGGTGRGGAPRHAATAHARRQGPAKAGGFAPAGPTRRNVAFDDEDDYVPSTNQSRPSQNTRGTAQSAVAQPAVAQSAESQPAAAPYQPAPYQDTSQDHSRGDGATAIAITVVAAVISLVAVISLGRFVMSAFGAFDTVAASRAAKAPIVSDAVASAQPVEVDLVMIGDVLMHQGVYESGLQEDGTYNFDHIFAHVKDDLSAADICVVNQETPLGGKVRSYTGYPSFNGPQEMGDAEAAAGADVILHASNHSMDVGYEGISSELQFWRDRHPNVTVVGEVDPEDATASVDDIYVYEKDGFRIALLNYTYSLNGYIDSKGVISMLDEEHVRETMQKADELADFVVVFPHWGQEYQTQPVLEQRRWEQTFIDLGADLIIGDHPHVIEPVETFTRTTGQTGVCFWSVGNFVSTQPNNEGLVGGMAKVTLRKDADGTCSIVRASMVPVVTHKGAGADMTTYLLRDYTDDLAATNAIWYSTPNSSLTPAWAQAFVGDVLGDDYDEKNCVLNVDLTAEAESFSPADAHADADSDADADTGADAVAAAA